VSDSEEINLSRIFHQSISINQSHVSSTSTGLGLRYHRRAFLPGMQSRRERHAKLETEISAYNPEFLVKVGGLPQELVNESGIELFYRLDRWLGCEISGGLV